MTDATPYNVPKEPGRWRAIILAALVHAALLAFLWIGVHWQNETPVTIEAEVWNPQPREAAPEPEPVKPPEPVKEPEPEPIVKEQPKQKVEEPPVVKPDPDIALEQEKKRKAEEKRREEEQEQERERLAKEKKAEQERLAKEKKAEQEKLAKLKQQEEEKRELEKEKAEKEKKLAAEKKRKQEEAEAKRKQEEADEKMMAKARDEEMRRIAAGVTGTGGTGDAPKTQGGRANAGYIQKVAARIKSHTVFHLSDSLAGNIPVEYAVELLPDGSLRGTPRKLKSSNVPGFDEAVLRAIEKSQPFPPDERSGTVPSGFTVSHKPKDQ